MPVPRGVVHGEWFDVALQRLGDLKDAELALAKEFYRIACYADLVALAPGSQTLRIYQTSPMLQDDGTIVLVLIYFVLRPDNVVELQHVETVDHRESP